MNKQEIQRTPSKYRGIRGHLVNTGVFRGHLEQIQRTPSKYKGIQRTHKRYSGILRTEGMENTRTYREIQMTP